MDKRNPWVLCQHCSGYLILKQWLLCHLRTPPPIRVLAFSLWIFRANQCKAVMVLEMVLPQCQAWEIQQTQQGKLLSHKIRSIILQRVQQPLEDCRPERISLEQTRSRRRMKSRPQESKAGSRRAVCINPPQRSRANKTDRLTKMARKPKWTTWAQVKRRAAQTRTRIVPTLGRTVQPQSKTRTGSPRVAW